MMSVHNLEARNARPFRLAIVGGGLTGIAAAIAFLRNTVNEAELWLFEPGGCVSGGLAYGEAAPFHLLNVRAKEVSVLPDRPDDFLEWCLMRLGSDHGACDLRAELAHRFLPRTLLRDYLEDRLESARLENDRVKTFFISQKVDWIRIEDGVYHLGVEGDDGLYADSVILATGYSRPIARHRDGMLDPYGRILPSMAQEARSAVILGTGLSMADAYVSLRKAGYQGKVIALSRRGKLPEPHETAPGALLQLPRLDDLGLMRMTTLIRRIIEERAAEGLGSQAVFRALRHQANSLWQRLTPAEQGRFLRHLKPWWDRYRHRMPAHLRQRLLDDMASGILEIRQCSIRDLDPEEGTLTYENRGPGARGLSRLDGDIIIDCRGHRPDLDHGAIRSLLTDGQLSLDRHRLGIAVDQAGAAIGADGSVSDSLFALGPLGLGSLFEISSIPEIVSQCRDAVARIDRKASEGDSPQHRISLRQ